MSMLKVTARDQDNVVVVSFNGCQIQDNETIADMENQFISLIDKQHAQRILLNVRGVEFFSVAAYAALIALYTKAASVGARVRVCCPTAQVKKVFRFIELDEEILEDDETKALNSLMGN